jgi:hypothetical protein
MKKFSPDDDYRKTKGDIEKGFRIQLPTKSLMEIFFGLPVHR